MKINELHHVGTLQWLDPEIQERAKLERLFTPFDAGGLVRYRA